MKNKLNKNLFSAVCKYLDDNGFRCLTKYSEWKKIYVKDKVTVTVEIDNKDEELDSDDIARIEKRLRELGYLE